MIYLNQLSFNYGKRKTLFSDLDLSIEKGNIYGLLGKNGAGKSTLLKLIAGLLFPDSGTCEVSGYRPCDRHPDFLSQLYFVPEELYVPEIAISTYEKLYAPFYPLFDHGQFKTYLSEFDIDASQNMQALSHGQKKKVVLSIGLATNCPLLILDEPTNGLDIPSKSQFRRLLAGAITDDRTFIVSTHQVRDMANLIDPIIILENSKIIFQESVYDTTQKLSFKLLYENRIPETALYSERVAGGYQVVLPNTDGDETDIDLEALFNAVVSNKGQISQLFNTNKKATSI